MKTDNLPDYYKPFVALLSSDNVLSALDEGFEDACFFFLNLPEDKHDYAYAEGKWTPKQILQHVIDTERILSHRALRFARQDMTQLAGFDHEAYVLMADVSIRSISDLVNELRLVRASTKALFSRFNAKELGREGFANGMVLSVENQAYVISGHYLSHRNTVRERYLV